MFMFPIRSVSLFLLYCIFTNSLDGTIQKNVVYFMKEGNLTTITITGQVYQQEKSKKSPPSPQQQSISYTTTKHKTNPYSDALHPDPIYGVTTALVIEIVEIGAAAVAVAIAAELIGPAGTGVAASGTLGDSGGFPAAGEFVAAGIPLLVSEVL
jgi:hypothetical protein